MGAYICRGGKKSGYAGYYFHVEPRNDGVLGGNILTSGLYLPDPKALKSIRDDIFLNGSRYAECIGSARGFSLWEGSKLKKVPAGYPAGGKYDEYLKLKDIYVEKHVGDDYLLRPGLLERVVEDFSHTHDLVKLLNRSVEYSRE